METTRPQCVGFIMDGNRRYATEQGLPSLAGHEAGERVFFATLKWLKDYQIPHGVYYAFSTENWKRSEVEVAYLLKLFERALEAVETVVLRIIGDRQYFSAALQAKMAALEEKSKQHEGGTTIWVALSYGGRAELVAATNEAIRRGVSVTEETFTELLWTHGMPDPDLIIRTGGEYRLSNFLLWQSAYSELMFTSTYWPAFTKEEFTRMLTTYGERKRRFGR
jgi:undecaprenyl diphosphate synthase